MQQRALELRDRMRAPETEDEVSHHPQRIPKAFIMGDIQMAFCYCLMKGRDTPRVVNHQVVRSHGVRCNRATAGDRLSGSRAPWSLSSVDPPYGRRPVVEGGPGIQMHPVEPTGPSAAPVAGFARRGLELDIVMTWGIHCYSDCCRTGRGGIVWRSAKLLPGNKITSHENTERRF